MKIENYSFGTIVIEGKRYSKDVIIFPGRVLSPWWRREGHLLQMDDLDDVMKAGPDILVIGQGYSGIMKVPRSLVDELEKKGIRVYVSKTTEAVKRYNELSSKKTIAAFHLTC